MKALFNFKYLFIFVLTSVLVFNSCSEDDPVIKGCTDPEAENYNPNAVESDNNCVFARDKFIGIYEGSLTCVGTPLLNQDSVDFTILENITGSDKVLINFSIMGVPTSINGTASGNALQVDDKIVIPNGGVINPLFEGVSVDIFFVGTIDLLDNGDRINGVLNLDAKSSDSGATIITDDCTVEGIRKT